ncbi:MAG TPA: sugar phosphate isomerase/epimerase [Firmicutes bacterium]|nr:sugar phosphate isomerase/epimerase [Bacillota bacterium]
MPIALCSWSVAGLDVTATVELALRERFDGVEWRVLGPGSPLAFPDANSLRWETLEEDAGKLQRLLLRQGLPLVNLLARVSLGEAVAVDRLLRVAADLACRQVCFSTPRCPSPGELNHLWAGAREGLRRAVEEGVKLGIRVLVETHMGTLTPSCALVRRLLDGVTPREAGAIYDPANGVWEGAEDPALAVGLLGDYLARVHIKDAVWERDAERNWKAAWVRPGTGMVPWARIMGILKDTGYRGWLGWEDLSPPADSVELGGGERWRNYLT